MTKWGVWRIISKLLIPAVSASLILQSSVGNGDGECTPIVHSNGPGFWVFVFGQYNFSNVAQGPARCGGSPDSWVGCVHGECW